MLLKIEFFMSLAGCPKVEVIGGKSILPSSDEQRKLEIHLFKDFVAITKKNPSEPMYPQQPLKVQGHHICGAVREQERLTHSENAQLSSDHTLEVKRNKRRLCSANHQRIAKL